MMGRSRRRVPDSGHLEGTDNLLAPIPVCWVMTTETTIVPDEEFLQFIRERAASLHRTAYLLCGAWHLADDLVQEALAKAFRHWRRVRRADSPDAYVHRILINEAKNYWRRQGDSERQSVFDEREITSPDMSDDVVD